MRLEEIDNQPYMIGSFNKEELDYMVHYLIGPVSYTNLDVYKRQVLR